MRSNPKEQERAKLCQKETKLYQKFRVKKAYKSAAAAKPLKSCLTLCDPIDGSPPSSPVPKDSPGKNTGVGCHFLLQCLKVKSESEVTQSCLTLCDPMDCSLPCSSVHGILQARILEWGAIAFSTYKSGGLKKKKLHMGGVE